MRGKVREDTVLPWRASPSRQCSTAWMRQVDEKPKKKPAGVCDNDDTMGEDKDNTNKYLEAC